MVPKHKILFFAGYFPPAHKASASVRGWNIAKYLNRLGWDVTVVTPHPAVWYPKNVQNVEATEAIMKNEGINRILTGYRWPFLAAGRIRYRDDFIGKWIARILGGSAERLGIDNWIGWGIEVEKACLYLKPADVDVILATGAPFISFRLACRLSERLNRPYVLDYRDLWTSNPHQKKNLKRLQSEENKLIADSAAVTVVSPSIGQALEDIYHVESKIHVLTNGYDPDVMVSIPRKTANEFAIVYTGSVYPPGRDISPFMAVLQQLKLCHMKDLPEWKFHYYGRNDSIVRESASKYKVLDKVETHASVPYETALSVVKGAGLALIITSVSEQPSLEEKGIVTGKIFEAIGLGTPILVVAPLGSDVRDIVTEAGRGKCFTAGEPEEILNYILELMYSRIPNSGNPQKYSWKYLGQSLDNILRKIC